MDETIQREFTEFVRMRGHALFRIAYSLCGQQQAAEDLVQTVFARAILRWRSIDGDPEPYVKRILYRQFVSTWRWRRSRPELRVGEVPEAAATGVSDRVNLQGGCEGCTNIVWLPGEAEVGIPVSANDNDGLQIYSVATGAKLRRVPWYLARRSGFSPDGRYVVAKMDNRAYWAGPDLVVSIEQSGAVMYSLQGNRIAEYPRPSQFTEDELPSFTLIR